MRSISSAQHQPVAQAVACCLMVAAAAVALFRGELLGIVQAGYGKPRWQHHGGGRDGPGEGAATGLIDSAAQRRHAFSIPLHGRLA